MKYTRWKIYIEMLTLQGNSLEIANDSIKSQTEQNSPKEKIQRDTNILQRNSLEAANYSSKINLDQRKTSRWQRDFHTTRKLITNSKLLVVFKSWPRRNTPMAKRFSHYKETHYKQQIIRSVQILTSAKHPDGKDTRCSHYKETHYKQQIIVVFKSPSERNTRWKRFKRYKRVFAPQRNSSEVAIVII